MKQDSTHDTAPASEPAAVLLTTEQVAQQLAVAPETVESWRHRAQGKSLPYVKLGRAVRYRPGDVAAFVQNNLRTL